MKKIVLFALGLVAVATAHAQDEKAKVETTVAADFVTNYIWRGLDCGNISVQPTLGIGYKVCRCRLGVAWDSPLLTRRSST